MVDAEAHHGEGLGVDFGGEDMLFIDGLLDADEARPVTEGFEFVQNGFPVPATCGLEGGRVGTKNKEAVEESQRFLFAELFGAVGFGPGLDLGVEFGHEALAEIEGVSVAGADLIEFTVHLGDQVGAFSEEVIVPVEEIVDFLAGVVGGGDAFGFVHSGYFLGVDLHGLTGTDTDGSAGTLRPTLADCMRYWPRGYRRRRRMYLRSGRFIIIVF